MTKNKYISYIGDMSNDKGIYLYIHKKIPSEAKIYKLNKNIVIDSNFCDRVKIQFENN